MLRATWNEGTAQLLSLTELKSHLFQLYFIDWTINRWRRGGNRSTRRKPLATNFRALSRHDTTLFLTWYFDNKFVNLSSVYSKRIFGRQWSLCLSVLALMRSRISATAERLGGARWNHIYLSFILLAEPLNRRKTHVFGLCKRYSKLTEEM